MPIIVGAPRSGTTLLRFMVDAHPEVAIPPETGFLALGARAGDGSVDAREQFFQAVTAFPPDMPAWDDFGVPRDAFRAALAAIDPFTPAAGYRAFYRLYARRFGKPRWGDKTPAYCYCMTEIAAVLPEARFVHVIRDGRDVCLSWRQTWFSPGSRVEEQAASWTRFVAAARAQGARCPHYLEIRYEDLILDPAGTLARVCDFIELPFDAAMLRYYERAPERLREHRARRRADGTVVVTAAVRFAQQRATTEPPDPRRVGAWRATMSADERARFEAVARGLLRELGYEARR